MKEFLPTGKLRPEFLKTLLENYTFGDESIIVGPDVGVDATVIDMGNQYLIAKTDPITFVADDIGYYAVNINANDIACMGGTPKWFLATLLLPENMTTEKAVEKVFSQISGACRKLKISFCGGHTEISYGIDRPILVGQMLGVVSKQELISAKNAREGDRIILTKGIAIEAVSIIARELKEKIAPEASVEFIEKCQNFIYDPGVSVLKDAKIAMEIGGIHAMHDPTEGGLAQAAHELAEASGLGIRIWEKEIPVLPEAKFLCDLFNLDVIGAIASGALLIVAERKKSTQIIRHLRANEIYARIIGKMTPRDFGAKMVTIAGEERDLPQFSSDEITKIF
ncbi:MAG: hydrogenase expression/formation protein [Calditrichaeota bacterium]|nr:hydrogenase expression/formation protein [Calditrichota bacterium]